MAYGFKRSKLEPNLSSLVPPTLSFSRKLLILRMKMPSLANDLRLNLGLGKALVVMPLSLRQVRGQTLLQIEFRAVQIDPKKRYVPGTKLRIVTSA